MPPQIVIDLWHDFAELCRAALSAQGHDVSGFDDSEAVQVFLNAARRAVPPRPRQVLQSKLFSCPSEHQQALIEIEDKILKGEDISPHLSRRTKDPSDFDPLRNHWGIHHLHLGRAIEADGYIERTNDLLFCRFDSTNAYLIDIYPHKGAWPRQEMMQIVHDNWPESITQWQLTGVEGEILTDEQIEMLRKHNANHALRMNDGTAYWSPGGGVTATGSNPQDGRWADCLRDWAQKQEQKIVDDWDAIVERARNRGVIFADPPELKLRVYDQMYCAVETSSNYALPLLDPESHCR